MDAKKQKCETPAETLYDVLKREPRYLTSTEVEVLNEQLGLDKIEMGFLMTRRQFKFWADVMKPYSEESCGLWSFQFHPLSGHMIHDHNPTKATKTVAFTKAWNLFRWIVNGLFMEDWIHVSEKDFDYVVFCRTSPIITGRYYERSWVTGIYMNRVPRAVDNNDKRDFFIGFDKQTNKRVCYTTHINSGRVYWESSAQPYCESQYDETPDPPTTLVRATLCLIRDAGGDDNLLAADNLPRDLFNLIVGMFK